MTWVKVETGFPRHPKVMGLSDKAFRTYLEALCYCAELLTDGYVPAEFVRRRRAAAAQLVNARLWTPTPDGDGYLVHDYLAHNRSRADTEQQRKTQSQGGRKGAERRWQTEQNSNEK